MHSCAQSTQIDSVTSLSSVRRALQRDSYVSGPLGIQWRRERERAGGERGIRTLDGVAPKPHFQLDPEEGSEGFLGIPEVRCRCFEES